MSLPTGEVGLHEVMEWAEEQSQFLRSPSQRLVLWYLCIHAWRVPDNPEDREIGDVLSRYASIARIQRGTGLSDKTARRTLQELQDEGYIIADLKHGNGTSTISVFWSENADERRADFRDGIRDLPRGFRRAQRKGSEVAQEPQDGVVLAFPKRSGLPE